MKPVLIQRSSWHYNLLTIVSEEYASDLHAWGSDSCTYTREVILALFKLLILLGTAIVFSICSLTGVMWLVGTFVNWEYSYIFSMLGMLVTAGWFVVHTYQLFSYETPYYAYYNIWHDKNGNAYSTYQEGYDARCAEREWKLKLSFRNRIRKAKNQHKYFGIKAMWESFKEKHCSRVKLDKRSW